MSINIFHKIIWKILYKFPALSFNSLDNLRTLGYFIIIEEI